MLSLCMIIKNEEKCLERCLSSVKNCIDEIVIVDTGSTDASKEIANKFNAYIYDYQWTNDFSAARNFGLSKAKGELILYLDADEMLTPESEKIIGEIKKNLQRKAYYCKITNVNHYTNRPALMSYPRIFPNLPDVKFDGKVHEQIIHALKKNNIQLLQSTVEIIHTGYDLPDAELKIKAKRNLEILLDDYSQKPNSYKAFQIAQSYNMIDNSEEAEKYFIISLQDINLPDDYQSTAYRLLSHFHLEKLDFQKSFDFISKALSIKKNSLISLMQRAKLFALIKDKQKCLGDIYQAMELSNQENKKNDFRYQEILIGKNEIIEEGLKYSIQFNDEKSIRNFINLYVADNDKDKINFINLVNDISTQNAIKDFKNIYNLTEKQLEIILLVISQSNDFDETLFEQLEDTFANNFCVKKEFGVKLLKANQYQKAEEKLLSAEKINSNDPSIVFYLISIFIVQGKINEAKVRLQYLESHFASNQNIINQIKLIQQRLNQS